MSDSVFSHLTSDDDDDTSKDLITFCMQLVHHSQWKSRRTLFGGSNVEISRHSVIVRMFDITNEQLDTDIMLYNISRYAVHRSVSVPETYTGDILRIYTDDVHTGYVRLIREKDNLELLRSSQWSLKEGENIHGPAVMTNIRKQFSRTKYFLSNAEADRVRQEQIKVTLIDVVSAVHSPYWPVEATEWITRRRPHGFPSKSVIKQVVRYGCDFVQVSHSRHSNDNEWRFSFSRAELFIVKSWSISQMIVYTSLWVLNKKIGSINLCTYYFKTLMFWACEEKPSQFWRDDLLVQSVYELLIEMVKWVKAKFCVNYFIPGNNMIDHLIDTDLSYEIDALWKTSQSRQRITEIVETCRQCEIIFANSMYRIECPALIKRAYVIYQWVDNVHDNFRNLFSTDLTRDLQNALYVELSDIYRGLYFQQKSVSCVNASDKQIYFLKAESQLLLANNLCELQERDVIDNCSLEAVQTILESYMSRDTDVASGARNDNVDLNTKPRLTSDRQNSLKDHNEQKCLLYSRSVEKDENKLGNNSWRKMISGGRNVNIELCFNPDMNASTDADAVFYKEWPGRSPTVNISWFIAKAYLANLYYTTQRDVSLTMKICDDIIDVYRQYFKNQQSAERIFPVVLSTQWTSIYDKEIQELLGFYSLCSYVFDPNNRSVYLGVCPVQFAFYLKLRLEGDPLFRAEAINNDNRDYYLDHIEACLCSPKVNNGIWILTRAWISTKLSATIL